MFAFSALAGCGRLDLKTALEAAVKKQEGLDSRVMELWSRSPVIDSGNDNFHAGLDPETVPRTRLVFTWVKDVNSTLDTIRLSVFENTYFEDAERVTFFRWAGRRVPWVHPDFQSLMAFYHGNLAADYASTHLSDYSPKLVTIYAAEPGDPFETHYSPSRLMITFYKKTTGIPFNPVDEADAVYHEYGHAVQHFLIGDSTQASAINYYFDALQEGLSDFAAAAIARDDRTNGYLAANTRALSPENPLFDRTGYSRAVRNELAFPSAWVGGLLSCHETSSDCGGNHNYHQDGRIVSGALNDIRRYLAGYDVIEKNCSGQGCVLRMTNPIGEHRAWDETYVLAHEAFRLMSDSKTLHFYAKNLLALCAPPAFEWCDTGVRTHISKILVGRGLWVASTSSVEGPYKWGEFSGAVAPTVAAADGAHLKAPLPLGWMPLEGEVFGNSNTTLGTCEAVFIFPNLQNVSHLKPAGERMRLAGLSVKIKSITGFTNLRNPSNGQIVEQVLSENGREEKFLGWLDPLESTLALVKNTDSPWYAHWQGTSLSAPPSLENAYSELAWLVRAPSSGVGQVTFDITARIFNRDDLVPLTFSITQQVTPSSSEDWCN